MQSNRAGTRAFQNARLQKKLTKQADAVLRTANAAYAQGRYAEADSLCRQILNELPQHFAALHLLGLSAFASRQFEVAKQAFLQAVTIDPRSAQALADLGATHFALGQNEEACDCLQRALALKPNFPLALANLGNALLHLQRVEEAIAAYDRAIALKPDHADALCNRGLAELALRRLDRASQSLDRALVFQPRNPEALVGRALVNIELKNLEDAKAGLDAALAQRPGSAKILANRGRCQFEMARYDQAAADFDAALAIAPRLEIALQGKAQVALSLGNTAQALLACTTLLDVNPRSAMAMALMSACFANQGEVASAIQLLDAALAIAPDASLIGRKIFFLDYLAEADFAAQQAARKQWWDVVGARLPRLQLSARQLDPDKRIRIGYVAAEFWYHSAAFTLLPLLAHHDHSRFEIVCYSSAPVRDEMTAKFQSLADVWVEAGRLTDDQLADRIAADQVDILIDVSGHTTGNRLPVFARRPAPIQVSGFGHSTGTGLQTMDYVLADPIFIPQSARHLLAEKVHDLPCLITIDPILDVPPSELPILRNGYVTFGVFNRIYKISDDAIRVWSRILGEVPDSRIVVKHTLLDDLLVRDGLIARLAAQGIAEERVSCLGSSPRHDHLRAFAAIDISLDPFPQNGGVSTWESLYAGVPVVTKLGKGASSRAGGSIVTAVGLGDWVADDDDGYVDIARRHAARPADLARLRADLPARIAASRAGNVETFTREVEAAYRAFWRDYCATATGQGR